MEITFVKKKTSEFLLLTVSEIREQFNNDVSPVKRISSLGRAFPNRGIAKREAIKKTFGS